VTGCATSLIFPAKLYRFFLSHAKILALPTTARATFHRRPFDVRYQIH
jgi:hypothetical protein